MTNITAKNKAGSTSPVINKKSIAVTSTNTASFNSEKNKTQDKEWLIDQIKQLKKVRNAVILSHNYQIPEIQDLADFVGDSLGLSQQAAITSKNVIVFCGVHFMAETAAILCPEKRVLIPDLAAGCSLASSINAEQLINWKKEHPGAVVVSYVNTTAEVKAESDYCCTSGNALKIVQAIPEAKEILFLPDQFLGSWVQKVTGRKNMHIWMGECHVHAAVHPNIVKEKLALYPEAELLIHPECGCLTPYLDNIAKSNQPSAIKVASTEGMLKRAAESKAEQFIVGTEVGIMHRLKKQNPDKEFIPIMNEMSCMFMKMITLEKLHNSLKNDLYPVTVSPDIAQKARTAIERMISIY